MQSSKEKSLKIIPGSEMKRQRRASQEKQKGRKVSNREDRDVPIF